MNIDNKSREIDKSREILHLTEETYLAFRDFIIEVQHNNFFELPTSFEDLPEDFHELPKRFKKALFELNKAVILKYLEKKLDILDML